jgi:hypothetical protein
MSRRGFASALLVGGTVLLPERVTGQQPLLGGGGMSIAPTAHAVQITTPVIQDSLLIRGVQQAVAPLQIRAPLRGMWNLEIAGAYVFSRLETGRGSSGRVLELAGPTDTRVRLYGPVLRDLLQLNIAVNAPTGLVELNAEQFAVLRTVAAPALGMPVPVMGGGLGGTVGLTAAYQVAGWALGAGLSHEIRTRYTPVEAALVGAVSNASLTPAAVTRSSVAASRAFGRQQVAVVAGMDSYGSDLVEAAVAGRTEQVRYRLGSTRSATANWHVSNFVVRSIDVTGSLRQRGAFSDARGQLAAGSDGTFADLAVRLGIGHPRRAGLELGGDVRSQSGLDIDPTMATAGVSAVGGGITLRLPAGGAVWRLSGRVEQGTLFTGLQDAAFQAATVSISIGPRTR